MSLQLPKRLKRILAAVGVLVAVVLVLISLGYLPLGQRKGPPSPPPSNPPEEGEPPTQFIGVEFIGRKDGQRKYHFHFDKVKKTEDEGLVIFEELWDGVIYQEDEPAYGITARGGQWLEAKDYFQLDGDINVTQEGELIFRSQRLEWDGTSEVLTAPTPSEISLDGINATSQELEAHVRTDKLHLLGDVVMWDDAYTIWSERVIYDRQVGELRLIGPSEIEFAIGAALEE
ncbi:MAG: LPS export ABC transporter periplasmic protein LptC [Firmicutes bacterium]|nr:LPS export ABC transporter periplasmic protein LptC [Bacillota bacterium]